MNVTCKYCGNVASLVTGEKIYPHRKDLYRKLFYQCEPCNAYVGCHPDSAQPLGTLANGSLRKFRSAAHRAFDPLWKGKVFRNRSRAYAWLSQAMNLPPEKTHIAMFDEQQCISLIDKIDVLLKDFKNNT